MNRDIKESRDNLPRQEILAAVSRLIAAARSSQNAADMFDEAVGDLLGINRTDARCVDLVQRYGRLTAGQLAELSGLTTGAVTTVIDRLEAVDYVRRVRDKKDRRRIFVELTAASAKMGEVLYSPLGEVFMHAMKGVSINDMRVIAEYLEFSERVNRRHTEIIQQHILPGDIDAKERLQRAKSFARESRNASQELVKTWGTEPEEAPVPGKHVMRHPE